MNLRDLKYLVALADPAPVAAEPRLEEEDEALNRSTATLAHSAAKSVMEGMHALENSASTSSNVQSWRGCAASRRA